MADVEQEKSTSGTPANTALKAAAAAAATGAATYAVRRAMSHDERSKNGGGSNGSSEGSGAQSLLASAATTGWDAASDVLIPFAEEAAGAAGKYLATHGPDILRDRIVPKFIEAFNDAK
jgi:D-alanyl-D-alanine carboxypeptidase